MATSQLGPVGAAREGPHVAARRLLAVAELRGAASRAGRVLTSVVQWYRRPTMRALKRQILRDQERYRRYDDRDNEASRLPATERVHLGGLVLMEAFTPSTVSALHRTLENWPTQRRDRRDELVGMLTRSRRGIGGGWQQLALSMAPTAVLLGDSDQNLDLPEGVEAVWLHLAYPMPSLAVVIATFTLSEQAGDLSNLLRADYQTQVRDVHIHLRGRGARWQRMMPWVRPVRHGHSSKISRPEIEKHHACLKLIDNHEQACSKWFTRRFPGRFSLIDPADRPVMRLMLTNEQIPFTGRERWMSPVGLDRRIAHWRSSEPSLPGWAISFDQEHGPRWRPVITAAARRRDAVKEQSEDAGESNWYLIQRFGTDQAQLAVIFAMRFLLNVYSDRLGDLRDRAATKRRIRLPVRQARELDRYLIGDGLDAVTVAADVRTLTNDLRLFRSDVPEYVEDVPDSPKQGAKRPPGELVPNLCTALNEHSIRLADDISTTTGNIRGSAELRQAIANTRLQRVTIALSLIAIAIAIISLIAI